MRFSLLRLLLRVCAILPVTVSFPAVAVQAGNELAAMKEWTGKTFLPKDKESPAHPATPVSSQPGIRVLRQDYAQLEINRSCIKTPIHIGTKDFAHGLGVNSISEIEVTLPKGVTRFEAQVGVDNNHDTRGTKGSVEFIVEADGRERFKSPVIRCGAEPAAVSVDLTGARILSLKVNDGGDGPGWDQGDWGDATLTLADGKKILLGELPVLAPLEALTRSDADLPFSFVYGGKSSYDLLKTWQRSSTKAVSSGPGRKLRKITWRNPQDGLEVLCELTEFSDFPASEWVVRLTNTGKDDSLVIERLFALDTVRPGVAPLLYYSNGSTSGGSDFLPREVILTGDTRTLSAANGRSSGGALPFFNLHDKQDDGGMMLAIGWSGQWDARFRTITNPQGATRSHLTSGQEFLKLKLKPGESIRTPRILMIRYAGRDPMHGQNLLRQTLLAHYVPRIGNKIAIPPVTANTWFTFGSGSGVNEANQLEAIATMAPLGIEDYWLDAGWYGTGDWSRSVGSWNARKDAFPRGLKPLGDACHAAGMKMVVWFEPERVQKNTTISIEHPEFVHGGTNGGLFKLDDPAARKWMTELLDEHIRNGGIDILRIDYNLDPLRYWRDADTPDTQGLTENRYVEGLYAMWDELRARHPKMIIDDCASGGRRIDLETISRSIPLWRSDSACCGSAKPVWDQGQVAGLSLWVPLHTGGLWDFDPYTARSAATAGASICADLRNKKYPPEAIKRTVAEIKSLRELWLGDYHPLTDIDADESHWMAWQFDRPDQGKGFAMVFRRPKVGENSFTAKLQGLIPGATYKVQVGEEGKPLLLSGSALGAFKVELPQASSSLLVTYGKQQHSP